MDKVRKGSLSFISQTRYDTTDELRGIDNDNLHEQKRMRYAQDTHYRRVFSWWVIGLVSLWFLAIISITFLEGLGVMQLPIAAYSTLLATTTANILGLAYIVLKGMFPPK